MTRMELSKERQKRVTAEASAAEAESKAAQLALALEKVRKTPSDYCQCFVKSMFRPF